MISAVSSQTSAAEIALQAQTQKPAATAQAAVAAPSTSGGAYSVHLSTKAPVDVDHDGDSH